MTGYHDIFCDVKHHRIWFFCYAMPENTAEAIGACGVKSEPQANANAVLIAHAPELARLLIRLNDAYEADPAELKDIASEIRPMLKKIGAI